MRDPVLINQGGLLLKNKTSIWPLAPTHVPTYKCTLTHACACVDVCEYRYSYKFLVGRTQLYSSVGGWVQLQFGVILALFTATGLISTWYFSKDAPRGILLSSRCWGMWLLDQCPHESLVGNARVHSEVSSHKVPAYPTSQSRDKFLHFQSAKFPHYHFWIIQESYNTHLRAEAWTVSRVWGPAKPFPWPGATL